LENTASRVQPEVSPQISVFDGVLRKFSRRTNGGRFIPEIDGLRFIAIALVVAYHADGYVQVKFNLAPTSVIGEIVARLLAHGAFGVAFFFVISGFVLGLPFARHHLQGSPPVRLKPYFQRRLTRLEPPYILALILCYLGIVLVGHDPNLRLRHLFASIFYVHNVLYPSTGTVSPVAWSLEVEVQFYLLVPLLTRVYGIRSRWLRRGVFAAMGAGVPALQVIPFIGHLPWVTHSIIGTLQYFVAGLILVDVYVADWRDAPKSHVAWDIVWVVGWGVLGYLTEQTLVARLAYPVVTFILYIAAFRGPIVRRIIRSPLLTTIGGMCYSIYLLHYPIISLVGRVTARLVVHGSYLVTLVTQTAIYAAVILLICGGYFRLIEQPCMRSDWPSRLKSRILAGLGMAPRSVGQRG